VSCRVVPDNSDVRMQPSEAYIISRRNYQKSGSKIALDIYNRIPIKTLDLGFVPFGQLAHVESL